MARCPHCNMVLSGSEAKASQCAICKGVLKQGVLKQGAAAKETSSSDPVESPTSSFSANFAPSSGSVASAESSDAPLGQAAAPASGMPAALKLSSTAGTIVALLAAWCLVMLIWFSAGDNARIPPRLLGAILLAAPVALAALATRESSTANESVNA